MNVRDINRRHTPLEIVQKIPWTEVKNCVVIYELHDGSTFLQVSEMSWKDLTWLTACLNDSNNVESAMNYIKSRGGP